MSEIVLTTLNARYQHSAFGLRYLMANLGELRARAEVVEFTISEAPAEILAAILERGPRIVGLGVYIWNVDQVTRVVADLKRLRPEIVVVIGGPEVSYDVDNLRIAELADYVIQGEADHAFREVCGRILDGDAPAERVIKAEVPVVGGLSLPYSLYSDRDIAERVIYVEASRGCPFSCEFCLSALDVPVRMFARDEFLAAMQSLLDRGARWFKFVDRTFNLNVREGRAVLEFFLERYVPGMFLHFEMIPDRLPNELKEVIRKFPEGALQFEIGIQTFNEEIADLISRRQDNLKVAENFRFLTGETGVHIHADLIFGLPGETLESFAAGFDRLVEMGPHEIQVGLLKRLRGTPIVRHDDAFQMQYSAAAPYEILQTRDVPFEVVQRVRRFAQLWDRVANRGHFMETLPRLWQGTSAFGAFLRFSDALFEANGRSHSISRNRLAESLFRHLTETLGQAAEEVAGSLWRDFQRSGRTDKPSYLRGFDLSLDPRITPHSGGGGAIPSRQTRHLTTTE